MKRDGDVTMSESITLDRVTGTGHDVHISTVAVYNLLRLHAPSYKDNDNPNVYNLRDFALTLQLAIMVGTARNDLSDEGYNPKADLKLDNQEYSAADDLPVGARGADTEPTNRDWAKEDKETEKSERTGQIPRGMFTTCGV